MQRLNLALALLLILCVSAAPLMPFQKEQLKGMEFASVVIEDLPKDALLAGLDTDRLRRDTELVLRRGGLTIVDDEGAFNLGATTVLVKVGMLKNGVQYSFSAEVQVKETATLKRNGAWCKAVVWERGNYGFVGDLVAAQRMRDIVKEMVEDFTNDHLASNPKR